MSKQAHQIDCPTTSDVIKRMRILFYVGPWIELDNIRLKNCWIPLCHRIIQACGDEFTFDCLLGKEQAHYWQQNYPASYRKLSIHGIFSFHELKNAFPPLYNATHRWGTNDYSDNDLKRVSDLCKKKLNHQKPDLIINFFNFSPFLNDAFPDARILYVEAGLFSQLPYPKSWYFDAFGLGNDNFVGQFGDLLKQRPLSDSQKELLNTIRTELLYKRLVLQSPFKKTRLKYNHFRKTILLPLQVSNSPSFDCFCNFKSQFEFLQYVLEKVPEDIGVIVTSHPFYPQLTAAWVKYFSNKYPNFIFDISFQNYWSASQFLLNDVDAVITVSSSVGLQALLWEKPLIVIGSSNIAPYANSQNIDDLDTILAMPYPKKETDRLLGHLLTSYWIADPLLDNGGWLKQFFTHCKQRQLNVDFYQQSVDVNFIQDWSVSAKDIPFVQPVRLTKVKQLFHRVKKISKRNFPLFLSAAIYRAYTYINSLIGRLQLRCKIIQIRKSKTLQRLSEGPTVALVQPTFYDLNGEEYLSGQSQRYLNNLSELIKQAGYIPFIIQQGNQFWHKTHNGIDVFGITCGSDYTLLNTFAHHRIFGKPKMRIYSPFTLAYPMSDTCSIGISHGISWDYANSRHMVPHVHNAFSALKLLMSVDKATISWFKNSFPKKMTELATSKVPFTDECRQKWLKILKEYGELS